MSWSSVLDRARAGRGAQRTEGGALQKMATVDIVGCGAVIKLFHLPALQWLEREGLVGVRYCLDPNPQAASAVASRLRRARAVAVSSPASFDGTGASAAIVATPPEHHSAWALCYLRAGADVLIEKPAVLTMEEFALLEEASRIHGRTVLAAHIRRLYPSVTAAREAVMSGRIGRVTGIEVHSGLRWTWAPQSDFPISSHAGGVLYDFGSHVLDAALFICGLDDLAWSDVAAERIRVERWPDREPSHVVRAELVLRGRGFEIPVAARLSRKEPLANVVRVKGERGEILVDVWYRPTCLLKTDGSWTSLAGKVPAPYADSPSGCYLAEDLELWRVWAQRGYDSSLALAHFGLLTGLLETLVSAQ